MDVSVEWIPLRDSLNRLSDESIPAITVCYEHIFEKILFDEELNKYFENIFNFKYQIVTKTIDNLIRFYSLIPDIHITNNISTQNDYIR